MPLTVQHIRNGKAISHRWGYSLLGSFVSAAEDEGGLEALLHKGTYTYREEHGHANPEDAEEEGIQPGDTVEAWR